MKTKNKLLITILLIVIVSLQGNTQNLSDFDLLAHYTLINTAADNIGYSEDITLKNMPYHGNDGVYSNGIYQTDDGCYLLTPNFPDWDYTKFGASIEFKIDDQDFHGPIIIFGSSYRYFGAWIYKSKIQLINNGGYKEPLDSVSTSTWHKLDLFYSDSIGKMYIDGKIIDSAEFIVNTGGYDNEKEITNYHGGNSSVFKGYLRNLKVYGEKSNSSSTQMIKTKKDNINIFPNPSNGNFTIDFKQKINENFKIHLINQNGIIVNPHFTNSDYRINIITKGIKSGIYFIEVFSQNEKIVSKRIIIY